MKESIEDKIDQLLVVTSQHSQDLKELKEEIKPILFHVNGVRWAMKLGAGMLAVLTAVAGILLALK